MFTVDDYKVSFYYTEDKQKRVVTTCTVNALDGTEYYEGSVTCSKCDHFRKATGRKAALQRAIAHLDRSIRSDIWATYFTKVKDKA